MHVRGCSCLLVLVLELAGIANRFAVAVHSKLWIPTANARDRTSNVGCDSEDAARSTAQQATDV